MQETEGSSDAALISFLLVLICGWGGQGGARNGKKGLRASYCYTAAAAAPAAAPAAAIVTPTIATICPQARPVAAAPVLENSFRKCALLAAATSSGKGRPLTQALPYAPPL